MQKISYADKVALNTNASVPDVNKCTASDMNSIKNITNANVDEYNEFSNNQETLNGQYSQSISNLENNKQDNIVSGTSLPATVVNGQIFLLYN